MDGLLTAEDVERMRLERGLTIVGLCRLAGVATTIFTRWKAGRFEPSMANYRKIRNALMSVPVIIKPPATLTIVESTPVWLPKPRQRNQVG